VSITFPKMYVILISDISIGIGHRKFIESHHTAMISISWKGVDIKQHGIHRCHSHDNTLNVTVNFENHNSRSYSVPPDCQTSKPQIKTFDDKQTLHKTCQCLNNKLSCTLKSMRGTRLIQYGGWLVKNYSQTCLRLSRVVTFKGIWPLASINYERRSPFLAALFTKVSWETTWSLN
jgi:hypothetical protein